MVLYTLVRVGQIDWGCCHSSLRLIRNSWEWCFNSSWWYMCSWNSKKANAIKVQSALFVHD